MTSNLFFDNFKIGVQGNYFLSSPLRVSSAENIVLAIKFVEEQLGGWNESLPVPLYLDLGF